MYGTGTNQLVDYMHNIHTSALLLQSWSIPAPWNERHSIPTVSKAHSRSYQDVEYVGTPAVSRKGAGEVTRTQRRALLVAFIVFHVKHFVIKCVNKSCQAIPAQIENIKEILQC